MSGTATNDDLPPMMTGPVSHRASAIPLVSALRADDAIAFRQGVAITVRRFLMDVQRVIAALPPGRHVLNNCRDRYHFAVGFAAALVSDRISLLPSTLTADTIRQLRNFASDAVCLSDQAEPIGLPHIQYPQTPSDLSADGEIMMPEIPADRVAASVFTSGSTGTPVPHDKTWGTLVGCVQAQAQRLAPLHGSRASLVGTVPPQHMYGFESTVLLALQGQCALSTAHPFYPADIALALAAIPRPRLLVTTPVHLRALLTAGIDIPDLDLLVSATAPLAVSLAAQAERQFGAPVVEIYGSTETGQIATRRTAQTEAWWLLPGIELQINDTSAIASGGHLAAPTPLSDILEAVDDVHFRLHGRAADMVNIAGKRSSLAHLNHHLNAIPGLLDGAFFIPDGNTPSGVARLMAFVVAPSLSVAQINKALSECIEPIFLPRPLVRVAALPRNQTGKLPREALAALAAAYAARRTEEADDVA